MTNPDGLELKLTSYRKYTQVKEPYNESDVILVSEFDGTYWWAKTDLYY
jgi:hypothetical protein